VNSGKYHRECVRANLRRVFTRKTRTGWLEQLFLEAPSRHRVSGNVRFKNGIEVMEVPANHAA
jgi:hypothetical protein